MGVSNLHSQDVDDDQLSSLASR